MPTFQPTETQRQELAAYWQKVKAMPLEAAISFQAAPATSDQLLRSCRLTKTEQTVGFDSLERNSTDAANEIAVLRQAMRRLVEHPTGWWMLIGPPGNAKSLILSIIVAESCRRGVAARYYNASEIDRATKPPAVHEDGVKEYEGNPDAFKAMAKRLPVLAIDECDKLNWTHWQIQHIGEILEDRYRNQAQRLTVFAANLEPALWSNAGNLWHLISRFNDGRFRLVWQGDKTPRALANHKLPDGRHYIPGVFTITLSDVRPALPAREF